MTRQPSQTYDTYWLVSASSKITDSESSQHSFPDAGKWLLFVDPADIDKVWQKIAEATKANLLGIGSKCSTMRKNPNAVSKEMVICVYTHDYNDKEDVFRVRQALRGLGFTKKIPYKTDQATRERKYSKNGTKTSLYYE